ncbi:aminotransferase class-V [Colletotrichum somersetense]|nr:aminotransferase class-V [Colletotrichum somersetense]
MENILNNYLGYKSTSRLDDLRTTDYSYLDKQGHLYLDFTGAGLAAQSQLRAHKDRLKKTLFRNPHSINPTSQSATDLVEDTRARVLAHLNASPDEYTVIFTPNATGAARLVAKAYPFKRGTRLVLTSDNHNLVNGLRKFAHRNHAQTVYVPARAPELRVESSDLMSALQRRERGLNFSGVRHPLSWVDVAQRQGYDVLLDAAAYLPTARLNLSAAGVRPEFVIVSWYKLFGYPTGVGSLVVRRDALARLASTRPWFSGGTVTAASVGVPWHVMAPAKRHLKTTQVQCLTRWCLDRLQALEHSNRSPVARIYRPTNMASQGGTIYFNFLDAGGRVVDERLVAMESSAQKISLRTGCFCNPGAGKAAFRLEKRLLEPLKKVDAGSLDDYVQRLAPVGAVRISFGFVSTTEDVDRFITFAEKTYQDRLAPVNGPPVHDCY